MRLTKNVVPACVPAALFSHNSSILFDVCDIVLLTHFIVLFAL